jgi:hypothetical protein
LVAVGELVLPVERFRGAGHNLVPLQIPPDPHTRTEIPLQGLHVVVGEGLGPTAQNLGSTQALLSLEEVPETQQPRWFEARVLAIKGKAV